MTWSNACLSGHSGFLHNKWPARYDYNFDNRCITNYDDTSKQGFKKKNNHLVSPINDFVQSLSHLPMLSS